MAYKGYGTPEQVARRRQIAEALAASVFRTGRAPQSIGDALSQGGSQFGAALASRGIRKKADKAEREGRESASGENRKAIRQALTGLYGGQAAAPVGDTGQRRDAAVRPSGALEGVDPRTVDALGTLQASYGQPLTVTSGLRSPEHNARVGGADQSRHMPQQGGDAVDIDTSGMSEAEKQRLLQEASAQGFTGIGVYDNSIHLDRGERRAWGPSYGRESVPGWAQPVVEAHLAGDQQAAPQQAAPAPQPNMELIEGLSTVLENPWSSDADKAMAQMVLEQHFQQLQGPEPKEYAIDHKIDLLMSTGLSRDEATRTATRYNVSRDPVTGVAQVVDKATGQVVGNLPGTALQPGATAAQRADSAGESPDYEGAFGAEGLFKNISNTLSDFVGFGQVFPDAAAGKRKLENLGVETKTALAGIADVRGGKYLMDEYDAIQARAGGLQGPEDAYNVLREMRDLIGRAIETSRRVAQSDVKPSEKSNANMTVERLGALMPEYDRVIGAFEGQIEGDIPTVQTPEEARQLPSGTKFRTPDGEIRVVP